MRFAKTPSPSVGGHGLHARTAVSARIGAAGCLHEVYAEPADWAAATIFALTALRSAQSEAKAEPVLLCHSAKMGLPARLYGQGLIALGIAPERLLFVHTRSGLEMLRAGVEAARCRGIAAVLLEIWGPCPEWTLTASRRLSLAAEQSGVTVLVLRGNAREQPSAAQTRWRVASAPSTALPANAPGLAAIDVELLRQRGGPAGMRWRLEWDARHGNFSETPLPGAVVPLSGLRADTLGLSRAA